MAESYAVNPGQAGGQGALSRPVLTQAQGVGGIGATRVGSNDGQDARNFEALLKLGSDLLAPHIKEAQTQQFLSGVQQAASGQGLQEILKDQPWYTQIFGPSSAAMGARTYTTQAAIAQFGADMEKAMPQLAKQGPEALMAQAQGAVKNLLTGDATADTAIMGSFVEQLQPLFKRHAKESYVYQQRKASAAQVQSWDSLFDAYQQRVAAAATAGTTSTPEDVQAEGSRLIGNLLPFADQSDESYQTNLLNAATGAARKGNFHAINLLDQEGLFKHLPPEDQGRLHGVLRQAGNLALDGVRGKYAVDIAQFVNDTAQDPRGIADRAKVLNAKAARETGVGEQYAQLVPNSTLDNIAGRVMTAQASADMAARSAAEKAAEKQRLLGLAQGLIYQPGGLVNATSIGLLDGDTRDRAVLQEWTQVTDPVKRAAILNADMSKSGYTPIAGQLAAMGPGTTDKNTAGIQHTAAMYGKLNDEARAKYFNTDEQAFYDRYVASVAANVPPEQAFLMAKVEQPLARNLIPADEKVAAQTAIKKEVEKYAERRYGGIGGWLGFNSVDDRGLKIIEAFISKDYQKHRGLHDPEVAAARSLATAMQRGMEVVGKYPILNKQPGQADLETVLARGEGNIGPKEVASRFETLLQEKAKAVGSDLKDYTILRAADQGGDPRYLVSLMDSEGALRTTYITGYELRHYKAPGKATKPVSGAVQ